MVLRFYLESRTPFRKVHPFEKFFSARSYMLHPSESLKLSEGNFKIVQKEKD